MVRDIRIRIALLLLACANVVGCGTYVQRHLDQGDVYFRQQKYREAIDEYQKAHRIKSDNPRANRQLGLAYFHLGDAAYAYRFLSKAESVQAGGREIRIDVEQVALDGNATG